MFLAQNSGQQLASKLNDSELGTESNITVALQKKIMRQLNRTAHGGFMKQRQAL